ncbi:hypothetical protein JRO89_XS05G0242400 [Xanthoceras sorbifolium]|uniref:Uncharacterized protein n=1 Tax=Xanthoceras sorbifolium TaxID=99658 RepID=A0ABQ8I3A4_9ROSI|nr:hypothetical protein JRO89_XS05G0242400 [Xanthoceras sorbifolium]
MDAITKGNLQHSTSSLRAVSEGTVSKHFGSDFANELFNEYSKKVADGSFFFDPDILTQKMLVVILKRKYSKEAAEYSLFFDPNIDDVGSSSEAQRGRLTSEANVMIQAVAVHGRCSMGPATLGRQVGHSRGLPVAVAGPVAVGKEQQVQGHHGRDATAVGHHRGEVHEYSRVLLVAQEAYSKKLGGEEREDFGDLFALVYWLSEFDGAVRLLGSCRIDQSSSGPGN